MRKLALFLIYLFFTSLSFSQQAPHALNYQAVARTSNGLIIPSQSINVRFSILDGSIIGSVVYQETQSATTNNFGLFTLAIGKGTVIGGSFNAINWETGDKFLKVELGPGNSGVYDLQGSTQLLSVPYALYSEKTKLLAGNNTISISNGNTISGNYQPGNAILINGNTISGNYQAGNAINISGGTISSNYVAGTGININGNTISETNPNYWSADPNGIHNQSGNVGVGTNSSSTTALEVQQLNTNGNSAALELKSTDTWHTAFTILNTSTANNRYSFSLGGINNTEVGANNFGILNHSLVKWAFLINGNTNNIGIGMNNIKNTDIPKSKLHIFNGDINIDQIGSGIIMKSPNGNCWRITIDNAGNLITTSIPCL